MTFFIQKLKIIVLIIPVLLAIASAKAQVRVVSLNKNWLFSQFGDSHWLPAEVPGCVHTDLLRNGKIDDPYYRDNESRVQWVGEKDWSYKTQIFADARLLSFKHLEIVFKGLDTYADIYLNGALLMQADNMHREWRISCKQLLRRGNNTLLVHFNNVFKIDTPKHTAAPYPLMAFQNNDQAKVMLSLYARKAGYEYGWDWGPRLITSGIFRSVNLEAWNEQKITSLQVLQHAVSPKSATMSGLITVESSHNQQASLMVETGGRVLNKMNVSLKTGINTIAVPFEISHPKLWWSNGLGKPNLYSFRFRLKNSSGSISRSISYGIRTIKIVRKDDPQGKSFYVLLNGVPVFIKGANYIPPDNFLNRVTKEKYKDLITSAASVHTNMLRVWGGGVYEDDAFYDLCDRYGILVWQDMMFACGMYPDDTHFKENVSQEVYENVARLRNHPCIALWCGNNENEISWYGWGWKQKYTPTQQADYEQHLHNLFDEVVPDAILRADTSRYYLPSSPSAGFGEASPNTGDVHYYDVWKGAPYEEYNTHVGRFMSEYGLQSFPTMKTIDDFTVSGDRSMYSPIMLSHQRARGDGIPDPHWGTEKMESYISLYYRQPEDFESMVYLSQVSQAKGIQTAIEAHRRAKPYCMGTMYWQLNDCWPALSWSGIDYKGRWKALQYRLREAYAQDLISIISENGKVRIFIVSDRTEPYQAELQLELMDFKGKTLSHITKTVLIPKNSSAAYFESESTNLLNGIDPKKVVLSAKLISNNKLVVGKKYYFESDKDLDLPVVKIHKTITHEGDNCMVTLSSDKLAKSVYLDFRTIDGVFSDNFFDLLPGERKTIRFIPKAGACGPFSEAKLEIKTLSDAMNSKMK